MNGKMSLALYLHTRSNDSGQKQYLASSKGIFIKIETTSSLPIHKLDAVPTISVETAFMKFYLSVIRELKSDSHLQK